jgi:BlaI family transcriptional regulator, penicillinase repressor
MLLDWDRLMARPLSHQLSRRERQIMDVLYRLGSGTVNEVLDALPDPPSYSAVRAQLRILEEKGHLRHEEEGPRYVYYPTAEREEVRRSMLGHVVKHFFGGSTEAAVSALLELEDRELPEAELDRLARLIERVRERTP